MTPFSVIGIVLVGAIAFFLGTDPLKMSMGSGQKEFQPQYLAPPSVDPYKGFPRDDANKLQDAEIKWRGEFFGPESLTFDPQGRGPYTGVSDGRVLRYDGPELGWTTFAYTSTNRSEVCAPKSPVAPNLALEHVCGRPLGLRFNKKTGDLWIADAYFGIMKVGPEGGQAEVVLSEIDGKPLIFANDLDIDEEGVLYFTDSSTKWQRKVFLLSILEGDVTGRFIKFNPDTKEIKVLIDNLGFPNGVAISKDGSFVLVAETLQGRVHRYWLKGEKAGTNDVFVDLPGWPDNVRCNEAGDFWVAIHARRMKTQEFLNTQPWLRALLVRLPIPTKIVYGILIGKPHGMVIRFSPNGKVQEVLEDQEGKVVKLVSEVEEHDGKLYLGSVLMPHVAVYTLPSRSSSSTT
jgi:sugar lactone lactonase YvrE